MNKADDEMLESKENNISDEINAMEALAADENTEAKKSEDEKFNLRKKIYNYIHSDDEDKKQEAFTLIYEETHRYVHKLISNLYKNIGNNWVVDAEDCFQNCMKRIFEHLEDYDPDKGAITTFVTFQVQAELCQTHKENAGISQHYLQMLSYISKVEQEYHERGIEPSVKDLVIELRSKGITEKTIKQALLLREQANSVSIDASEYDYIDSANVNENTNYYAMSPDEILSQSEESGWMKALQELPELERLVLEKKVFSNNAEYSSYLYIARELNMKEEQVKILYANAQKKLRQNKYFARKHSSATYKEYKALNSHEISVIPIDVAVSTMDALEMLDF